MLIDFPYPVSMETDKVILFAEAGRSCTKAVVQKHPELVPHLISTSFENIHECRKFNNWAQTLSILQEQAVHLEYGVDASTYKTSERITCAAMNFIYVNEDEEGTKKL